MKPFTNKIINIIVYCLTLSLLSLSGPSYANDLNKTYATLSTSKGDIKIELYTNKTPKTVANFIQYAESNFYNGTIFHRVIPGFMIQGGGFGPTLVKKMTKQSIINEANPFIPNRRGTIAMARTTDPDSATSQFFINVANNTSLNKSSRDAGYAVFGKVIEGMIVADQISSTTTGSQGHMRDVPIKPITINAITIQTPYKISPEAKPDSNKNAQ